MLSAGEVTALAPSAPGNCHFLFDSHDWQRVTREWKRIPTVQRTLFKKRCDNELFQQRPSNDEYHIQFCQKNLTRPFVSDGDCSGYPEAATG